MTSWGFEMGNPALGYGRPGPLRGRGHRGGCAGDAAVVEARRGFPGRQFPRMKGIHCALQGRLGQDVELRRSESGKTGAGSRSAFCGGR